jgi:hypothetical protein
MPCEERLREPDDDLEAAFLDAAFFGAGFAAAFFGAGFAAALLEAGFAAAFLGAAVAAAFSAGAFDAAFLTGAFDATGFRAVPLFAPPDDPERADMITLRSAQVVVCSNLTN